MTSHLAGASFPPPTFAPAERLVLGLARRPGTGGPPGVLVGDQPYTSHGPGQPRRDVECRPKTMTTLTFCTTTHKFQHLVSSLHVVAFRPRKLAQSLQRDVGR